MPRPTISVCLIARNEERMLPQCLASVRDVADQIVVVDTGSSDGTPAIAAAAGAVVLQRPWDEDFAAPRNLALEHATGDFILQIDADERLHAGGGAALRAAARAKDLDVGFLRLHNATRLDAGAEEVVSGACRFGAPHRLPRLIRRTPDLRYRGIIHESIHEWSAARGCRFRQVDADLIHLGNVRSVHADREKKRRNLALLRRRVEQEPDDVTPLGYLAAELVEIGDWDGAAAAAERGWALLARQPSHRSFRRLLVARAVAALHRKDLARVHESVARAEAHEGPNPDYDHLRGCAWEAEAGALPGGEARRALLEQAEAAHRRALDAVRLGCFIQVMVAGEPQVLARLGSVLFALGRSEEGQATFAAARAAGAGESVRVLEAAARVSGGDPAGALAVLQPVLEHAPEPAAWAVAARAALALGSRDDAAVFLARARALQAARG